MDSKQKSHSYKQFAIYVAILYLLFLFLPLAIYHFTKGNAQQPNSAPSKDTPLLATSSPSPQNSDNSASAQTVPDFLDGVTILPKTESPTQISDSEDIFRIKDLATESILSVSAKDFLPTALACEMPLSAPDESLKAQVVAAYTYYSAQRDVNGENDYDLTCNSDTWMIYTTQEKLKERWGEKFDTYWEKASSIVDTVYGETLTENNEPILAAYFAMSNGSTEASANVWGSERSYLTSVASPGDLLSDGYLSHSTFTTDEMKEKLQTAFPEESFDFNLSESEWFSAQELSSAGYTKTISVCGVTVEGTKLRSALLLSSTSFDVSFENGNFLFTVRGRGHGVGMSQVGAMYMAQQGVGYQEILLHYYPGTTLINVLNS